MRKQVWGGAVAVMVVALTNSAWAGSSPPLLIEMNHVYSSQAPTGDVPWMTALFEDNGNGSVKLTLDTGVTGFEPDQGLSDSENVKEWYFNLDPSFDANDLAFSDYNVEQGAVEEPTVSTSGDHGGSSKAGGSHGYDFVLQFANGGSRGQRFEAAEKISYVITLDGGSLIPESFNFMNDGKQPFISAAHIRSISDSNFRILRNDDGSGWVSGSSTVIPTPAASWVGVLAFGALAGMSRFRRQPNRDAESPA